MISALERVLCEQANRVVWFVDEDGALSDLHLSQSEVEREFDKIMAGEQERIMTRALRSFL